MSAIRCCEFARSRAALFCEGLTYPCGAARPHSPRAVSAPRGSRSGSVLTVLHYVRMKPFVCACLARLAPASEARRLPPAWWFQLRLTSIPPPGINTHTPMGYQRGMVDMPAPLLSRCVESSAASPVRVSSETSNRIPMRTGVAISTSSSPSSGAAGRAGEVREGPALLGLWRARRCRVRGPRRVANRPPGEPRPTGAATAAPVVICSLANPSSGSPRGLCAESLEDGPGSTRGEP